MKCEFCDNEATISYEVIVDGISKKTNICQECADERGITSLDNFDLGETILEKAMEINISAEPAHVEQSDKVTSVDDGTVAHTVCDCCGFTLQDFRKVGRLGCSECYRAFSAEISQMLENMHKGKKHRGKQPRGREFDDLIINLQKNLEESVAAENYEEAAKLRDLIKQYKLLSANKI